MKLIASDRRYKWFDYGLEHIIEFRSKVREHKLKYIAMCRELEEMYGPAKIYGDDKRYYAWKYNTNYRVEQNNKKKICRIYLRNGGDATMLALKIGYTDAQP